VSGIGGRTGFVSRIAQPHASEGGSLANVMAGGHSGGNRQKTPAFAGNSYFSVKRP